MCVQLERRVLVQETQSQLFNETATTIQIALIFNSVSNYRLVDILLFFVLFSRFSFSG